MEETKECFIPFRTFADGVHDFEFKIGNSFFEAIENSLILKGELMVRVQMSKSQQMLKFHFDINGKITVPCDVCLEDMDYEINDCEGDMVVKFGATTEEISDDLFQLSETEDEISVAQWIYEILAVSLPIKFVHPEDENGVSMCNPDMLKRLNEYLVSDDDVVEEKDNDNATDPRWDALKKLRDNN